MNEYTLIENETHPLKAFLIGDHNVLPPVLEVEVDARLDRKRVSRNFPLLITIASVLRYVSILRHESEIRFWFEFPSFSVQLLSIVGVSTCCGEGYYASSKYQAAL